MRSWEPDVCIHHFPCDDGFTAAWVVHRRWPETEFRGTNYDRVPPIHDLHGKNVLIVDFSFSQAVMCQIGEVAKSVVVLDHHKTAQEALSSFKGGGQIRPEDVELLCAQAQTETGYPIICWFDMEQSGAMLAWKFVFTDGAPRFVEMIQDRDLWRMVLPGTRAFSMYLRSWPMTFDAWDSVYNTEQMSPDAMMIEAHAIERFFDRKMDEVIAAGVRTMVVGGVVGVPVANVPWFMASDMGHRLLMEFPDAPFAAAYYESTENRGWSLRSESSRTDVSEIAKLYGGGGHRNAAGFRTPL